MSTLVSTETKIKLANAYAKDSLLTKDAIQDIVDVLSRYPFSAEDFAASYTENPLLRNVSPQTQEKLLEIMAADPDFSDEEKSMLQQTITAPPAPQSSGLKM